MVAQPRKQIYEPKTRLRQGSSFAFDSASLYSYNRAIETVRRNSLIGAMIDLMALWGRKAAFKYVNEDREIYEFIVGTPVGEESQFYQSGQLQGRSSLGNLTAKFSSYPIFGNAYAEFAPMPKQGKWQFGALNKLEPGDYKFIRRDEDTEEGLKGSIAGVQTGGNVISLENSVYLRHGDSISFEDPYGYAIYERLEPLAQAWKFVLEELLTVVGQQGGKKLIGEAEPGKSPLLGPTGRPLEENGEPVLVSNTWLLADQLAKGSKNTDAVVTTSPNKIHAIDTSADGDIFKMTIELLRTLILMALLSPEGVFLARGGLGSGGMSEQHTQTLMDFIDSIAESIAEEIQRVVIDNLVIWNFGLERNRGALVKPANKDPDRMALLAQLSGFVEESLKTTENELIMNKVRSLIAA